MPVNMHSRFLLLLMEKAELLKARRACGESEGETRKVRKVKREVAEYRLSIGQPPAPLLVPNVLMMSAALQVVKVQGCQATSM